MVFLALFIVSAGGLMLGTFQDNTICLLNSIWVLVAGIFGIMLQNYLDRIKKNIEEEDKKKETDHAA